MTETTRELPVLEHRYFRVAYRRGSRSLDIESRGLTRRDAGTVTVLSAEEPAEQLPLHPEPWRAALRCKGIVIEHGTGGAPRIYSDPFCTIPVYFTERGDEVVASSSPGRLISYPDAPLDPAGFWETVIFGTGIWTRTPFRELRQLPSACRLPLDDPARLSRYWNFTPEPAAPGEEWDERLCLEGLDALLKRKFETLREKRVVLGLSGGMDSRIAALYLSGLDAGALAVRLFTFASSKASYEHRYATEVARTLGLPAPELFLLDAAHYREALNYLPFWTAGQIGNNHGHITQYLRHRQVALGDDAVHLSTYYSDALLGWECSGSAGDLTIQGSSWYQKALAHPWLPDEVREIILSDIATSLKHAAETTGFSSVIEFRYLTERNAKFHLALAFAQSQFMRTVTPFADYDLLSFMLQVPLRLRSRKRIVDELIKFKNPALSRLGNSSSREYFNGSNSLMLKRGFADKLNFLRFRALNAINDCAVYLTDRRMLDNPFQTEEPVAVYRRLFSPLLAKSLELGPLSELIRGGNVSLEEFTRPRLRDGIIAEKYQLLNLSRIISHSPGGLQPSRSTFFSGRPDEG